MTGSSLGAAYFDGILSSDEDPWNLASSDYEAAKFDRTIAALQDRRFTHAFEVGCAQGVLTARLLGLCDKLLAVDISSQALKKAHARVGDRPGLMLRQIAFPWETPDETGFDLVMLSEVAYYWGVVDLDRAAEWLKDTVAPGGLVVLVHWLGETDYPQTGDGAVETLWEGVSSEFDIEHGDRTPDYRLDVWIRR